MALKDFIGKIVINTHTKNRFRLHEVTAPEITLQTLEKNRYGTYSHYCFPTVNGDPFTSGTLVFEDPSLKEPFLSEFNAHCHSEDGRWENYGYWLMRD